MRLLLSYTHASCTASNYLQIHHVHISSFKYAKCVWMGSRISVGSAADMVKLTHYKWICNPQVDLNCVYCYCRCVCVRARLFECVCAAASVFLNNAFVHIAFRSYATNLIAD